MWHTLAQYVLELWQMGHSLQSLWEPLLKMVGNSWIVVSYLYSQVLNCCIICKTLESLHNGFLACECMSCYSTHCVVTVSLLILLSFSSNRPSSAGYCSAIRRHNTCHPVAATTWCTQKWCHHKIHSQHHRTGDYISIAVHHYQSEYHSHFPASILPI